MLLLHFLSPLLHTKKERKKWYSIQDRAFLFFVSSARQARTAARISGVCTRNLETTFPLIVMIGMNSRRREDDEKKSRLSSEAVSERPPLP